MLKKMLLIMCVVAVSAMASAKSYNVKFFQPTTVGAIELAPGNYKVEVEDTKAVITNGKEKVEAEVAVETADQKFNSTSVRYQNGDGKYRIREIRVGGTNTKLVFAN